MLAVAELGSCQHAPLRQPRLHDGVSLLYSWHRLEISEQRMRFGPTDRVAPRSPLESDGRRRLHHTKASLRRCAALIRSRGGIYASSAA